MNKYLIYYAIILSILAGKVVTTIYQGSMVVDHGSKIAQLQTQKQELKNQQRKLSNQLAERNSLNNIMASEDIEDYTAITQPLIVETTTTVAVSP